MRSPRIAPCLTALAAVAALLLACGGGGGGGGGPQPIDCGALSACGVTCVDLQTSADHCGACGHGCGLGSCVAGACVCETTPATVTSCGAASSPECADTATDGANCGTCGHGCSKELAGSQCAGGACQCLDPRPDRCASGCKNLQTDASNCGDCGHACPLTNDVCVGGACQCPAGLPDTCGSSPGTCVSKAKDPKNCGDCGHACPAAATCSGSTCQCPAATPTICAATNTCANLKSDVNNCGACGIVCAAGASCTTPTNATTAQCACPTGDVVCGRSSGVAGKCCAGNGCCPSGACQTAHANGLGQSYYDCGALDEHTQSQAVAAAQAWAPAGTPVESTTCVDCICAIQGTQAAVWCYAGGTAAGRVGLYDGVTSCLATPGCPQQGASNVFTWQ